MIVTMRKVSIFMCLTALLLCLGLLWGCGGVPEGTEEPEDTEKSENSEEAVEKEEPELTGPVVWFVGNWCAEADGFYYYMEIRQGGNATVTGCTSTSEGVTTLEAEWSVVEENDAETMQMVYNSRKEVFDQKGETLQMRNSEGEPLVFERTELSSESYFAEKISGTAEAVQ